MNSKSRYLWSSICAAAVISAALPERGWAQSTRPADEQASQTQFVRLHPAQGDAESLQTAITRYESGDRDSVVVDLIGAVHIGEGSYYKTLNDLFSDYDVVLYELVAPEGTRIPRGGGDRPTTNPISFLQTSAQRMLGLESQLKLVDYTPENLRHADLSPAEMAEKMKERGDTTMSLVMGALTEMMNNPEMQARMNEQGADLTFSDMADMLTNPLKAKRFMAQQFAGSGMMDMGLGSGLNRLIVEDRNKAAMEVLDEVIEEGHKKVAIFYGAAHMPDFEQRLNERDFDRTAQSWVTAWDLTQSQAKAEDSPMSMLMQLMKELDR